MRMLRRQRGKQKYKHSKTVFLFISDLVFVPIQQWDASLQRGPEFGERRLHIRQHRQRVPRALLRPRQRGGEDLLPEVTPPGLCLQSPATA